MCTFIAFVLGTFLLAFLQLGLHVSLGSLGRLVAHALTVGH